MTKIVNSNTKNIKSGADHSVTVTLIKNNLICLSF